MSIGGEGGGGGGGGGTTSSAMEVPTFDTNSRRGEAPMGKGNYGEEWEE